MLNTPKALAFAAAAQAAQVSRRKIRLCRIFDKSLTKNPGFGFL
jgi:hypothetical protein